MPDLIGWFSSAVLLATLCSQIYKQWRHRTAEGVSKWLFIGQTVASFGFIIYSVLLHNWVFIVTNGLLLLAGVTGFILTFTLRRQPAMDAVPRFGRRAEDG